ncbi:uncharacterized protein A4U43_UnF6150 [Asparagus officinalis]|uniref:ENTH domain-containing protein n=1 Tax=Asparagus officinalis TaxID=4686 RepID=A0A1R3L6J0_ASPOF|nr:uncharacterized protein A4U43_UnF6150 [Asparagus officinalis]
MLNMSDFRDTKCSSRGEAWDYSAFVRTYARYLDEMLEYRMHGRRKGRMRSRSQQMHEDVMDEEERERDKALVVVGAAGAKVNGQGTPVREMTTENVFARTQHLQQQLERFLACRPTGSFFSVLLEFMLLSLVGSMPRMGCRGKLALFTRSRLLVTFRGFELEFDGFPIWVRKDVCLRDVEGSFFSVLLEFMLLSLVGNLQS